MSKKFRPGVILQVPIDNNTHTYARILTDRNIAFYDYRTAEEITNLKDIISAKILFIICVNETFKNSWEVKGDLELEPSLRRNPLMFICAPYTEDYKIYDNGEIRRNATKEECMGLERVVAWSPERVEGRLLDHYNGHENEWVEAYKIK
ncbi:Imm26 family immunity protein [Spirochaeta cellobiosiphila]|uniref:Imm26 family immunity protein n=1 Tax=Spirochaeta cellobiosiphila TaxID=504483 RepID=UPI000412FAAF|nr:Imm26 family immunity protein [Spirochaeta cellobiosiphila]